MTPDDLDRMLSTEDDIVPTSGFAFSVMERVRREASAAPPIPFPWKRFAAGILALLWVAVALASSGVTEPLLARIAGLHRRVGVTRVRHLRSRTSCHGVNWPSSVGSNNAPAPGTTRPDEETNDEPKNAAEL